MAETLTIARPYAEALFQLAQEESRLADWNEILNGLATLAENAEVATLACDPRVSSEQVQSLLLQALGRAVDPQLASFLQLLLENGRFVVLPEIAKAYADLREAAEDRVEARVETAFALTESQLAEIQSELSHRCQRQVVTEVNLNPALLGGVRVTIGDTVIDASVRGKLDALASTLKS